MPIHVTPLPSPPLQLTVHGVQGSPGISTTYPPPWAHAWLSHSSGPESNQVISTVL
ncbi:hypothetical protein M404DRAFT_1002064 [Pisolithus tinctorius Marx 270]|uniref:Uncharacterized protein n=1 Tax=Pisolithus tinctorius Marx 270 TaxID=870435 RepID=A0A0C3JZR1_PISTI|nr:hypothetical protein M404DRAFT_1002064 [Pisolithus tinctorius Marx 270]